MKRPKPLSKKKLLKFVREAVAAGRIYIEPIPKIPAPIKVDDYTFTGIGLDGAWSRKDSVGFVIRWSCKGIGFGELTFYRHPSKSQLYCDNECESRKFTAAILKAFMLSCMFLDN